MQWKNEIEAHSEGLSVLVWHGASRETDTKELKKFDVVRILSLLAHDGGINLFPPGPNDVCCPRELLPKATYRFQTQG